jgi:uncharacterized protein with beta-barrel porin domain
VKTDSSLLPEVYCQSGGFTNANTVIANGGAINGAIANNAGGNFNIGGTVTSNSTFSNSAATSRLLVNSGTYTVTGPVTNSGTDAGGGILVAAGAVLNASAGGVTNNAGATIVNNGTIDDALNNAGTVTNNSIYNANVATNIGTITNNGIWAGNVQANAGTINNNQAWIGTITSSGTFNNNAPGTVSGLVTNSGIATNSGTLNGGLSNTAGTMTNSGMINGVATVTGGIFTGTGTTQNLAVNGGTFAPGNGTPGSSMSVTTSLSFQSAASFMVQINPTTSSLAKVTGTATLGGATVNAVFANGSYVAKQYTILTATGGVSGSFGSLVNTNLPSGFKSTLSYDASDAFLNLALGFAGPSFSGLNGNQQNVGNTLTRFFNSTGGIPIVFGALTPTQLSQASGETATGSQQTTFDAMSQFMGVMTDPFMSRTGGANSMPGATGYAEEASAYAASKKTDAFAMFTKAPPAPFEQRWSVWAAGFGGAQNTDGNTAVGSNNTTSSIAGTAVGADYLFSPNTIAGFALAGGGTSFSVANGGSGRSDLFQAGAYLRHTDGPAYVSAAVAYGWQDITTNRTVTIAGLDQLRAEFNANAWSGRLEGGYRFISPATFGIGITPYAAAQFVTFDLPAYAEQAIAGANTFALTYGAKDVTDARTELGLRSDKSFTMADGVLTLRGRVAWAHDYDPNRAIAATFQTLPGASFVVNGAAQSADSALTTASIEKRWLNGWSAAATFEGEFSDVTRSYAGKGVVRYAW